MQITALLVGLMYDGTIALFAADGGTLNGGPIGLRRLSSYAPLPIYPISTAKARREGRVTVDVIVEADGAIGSLKILESVDAETAASVQEALRRWRFRVPRDKDGKPSYRVVGRLVFYFTFRHGKPVVIDGAAEMINRGRPH